MIAFANQSSGAELSLDDVISTLEQVRHATADELAEIRNRIEQEGGIESDSLRADIASLLEKEQRLHDEAVMEELVAERAASMIEQTPSLLDDFSGSAVLSEASIEQGAIVQEYQIRARDALEALDREAHRGAEDAQRGGTETEQTLEIYKRLGIPPPPPKQQNRA